MTWLEISDLARHMWVAWLMLVFVGIGFYAFRPKNKRYFEDCSQIPFAVDDADDLTPAGPKAGEFRAND